jgi:hypothetical protein
MKTKLYANKLQFLLKSAFTILLFSFTAIGGTVTWTGNYNSDWSNALNWSGGVPDADANIEIPGSLSTYPVFYSPQSSTIKSLLIKTGGIITLSGGTLTILNSTTLSGIFNQTGGIVSTYDMEIKSGGVYNQSAGEFIIGHNLKVSPGNTFNGTGGTVRFAGSADGGADFTGNVQFYNMIVNAGANYKMDNSADVIKVSGNFTNNNSSLPDNNGTLVLNGSAAQTYYSASPNFIASNVIVTNSVGVTLLSDLRVEDSFSLQSGGHVIKNGNEIYVNGVRYDGPTPVELISFNASVQQNSVNLRWETATEVNNYGFEIERSQRSNVKNQNWENIGFVNGYGNSNSLKNYYFKDDNLNDGSYSYRLKQIDNDGTFTYSNAVNVPINISSNSFVLHQNYPNPFNPTTRIAYSLPQESFVTIKIYDILGNELAVLVNENQPSGPNEINFDGSQLASGTYIYKIQTNNFSDTKKMILSK